MLKFVVFALASVLLAAASNDTMESTPVAVVELKAHNETAALTAPALAEIKASTPVAVVELKAHNETAALTAPILAEIQESTPVAVVELQAHNETAAPNASVLAEIKVSTAAATTAESEQEDVPAGKKAAAGVEKSDEKEVAAPVETEKKVTAKPAKKLQAEAKLKNPTVPIMPRVDEYFNSTGTNATESMDIIGNATVAPQKDTGNSSGALVISFAALLAVLGAAF